MTKRFTATGKGSDRRASTRSTASSTSCAGRRSRSTSSASRHTITVGDRVYYPAKSYAALTPGSAVRVFRELQEMTQSALARATGMTQATVSSIEHDRVALGVDRAKRLAIALRVHPAVLLFPNWEAEAKALAERAACGRVLGLQDVRRARERQRGRDHERDSRHGRRPAVSGRLPTRAAPRLRGGRAGRLRGRGRR